MNNKRKTVGFLGSSVIKNPPALQETQIRFDPLPRGEDSLEKEMATHPVFLPGEFNEQRSLVGYSPWGRKELDTT